MTPLFLLFAPLTLGVRELRRVVLPVWLGIAAYLARSGSWARSRRGCSSR